MSSNSLWSKWMACRCFPNSSIWDPSSTKSESCIWRSIRKLVHHIHSGSKWSIANGKSIDFWFDSWSPNGCLASMFPFVLFPPNQKLFSLWEGANWVIPQVTPVATEVALSLAVQSISLDFSSNDQLVWTSHPDKGLSL